MRRDPSAAELREAVLPYARALGCRCAFKATWHRHGDLAEVDIEHEDWCRLNRDLPEPVVIAAGRWTP